MSLEEDQLLEDMNLDIGGSMVEDSFFSGGSSGMVNLSTPAPMSFGNSLEEGLGAAPSGSMNKGADDEGNTSASMGIAAAAAAATAGAVGSALIGGNFAGAQSVLSSAVGSVAGAAVPTSLQPVKETAGRFLSKAQPWKDFLLPLSVPAAADGCSRLTANIYTYQTNYAILFVIQLIAAIVFQPSALITIILTVVVWIFFLKKNDEPEWAPVVGGVQLGPMQRWLLMVAATAVVLLFVAGGAISSTAMFYVVGAFIHGVLHDTSAKGIPGADGVAL